MTDPAWAWPAGLGFLGLIFGSFIATFAIRWPQGRSALAGRSHCDGCGRTLSAAELVPVVGWLALRGRCRTCGGRIAPSHPVIELLALGIGVAAGSVAPGWDGVAGAVFGWLLLALAAIDLACFRLPNALTALLALGGIVAGVAGLAPALPDRLIGGFAGFAGLTLVAALYQMVRHRVGLGAGDAKLFGGIGLWLGWRDLPATLLVACGIGLTVIAVLLLRGWRVSRLDRLPFGTLLAASAFLLWIVSHRAS